jgi:hypothetical protein
MPDYSIFWHILQATRYPDTISKCEQRPVNLSIKGRLIKEDQGWVAEFTPLSVRVKAPTPFKSIQALASHVIGQLEGKDNKCSIKVDEEGVFYIVFSRHKPLIKFIASCLTQNCSEPNPEMLNDWFWIED